MRLVKVCLTVATLVGVVAVSSLVVGDDERTIPQLSPAGPRSAAAEAEKRDRLVSRAAEIQRLEALYRSSGQATASEVASVSLNLSGYVWYREAYGSTYYFMGEVVNSAPSGSATPCFVKVFLELYDASVRLIASDWTYVTGQCNTLNSIDSETGTCIAPQKRGVFGLYTSVNIASVASVRVTFDYDTPQISTPDARIQVEGGWFATPAYDSTVFIQGRMKNTSTYATAKFCQETAVLKGFDGALLDVDWTYVDGVAVDGTSTGLRPGQSGPFSSYTEAYYGSFNKPATVFYTEWDDVGASPPRTPTPTPTAPPAPTPTPTPIYGDCSVVPASTRVWFPDSGGSKMLQVSVTGDPGCETYPWTVTGAVTGFPSWFSTGSGITYHGSMSVPLNVEPLPEGTWARETIIFVGPDSVSVVIWQGAGVRKPSGRVSGSP